MNRRKMLIKVIMNESKKLNWIHLCYIDSDLYFKFLEILGIDTGDMNSMLSRWCKESFNMDLGMVNSNDIEVLKAVVKDYYKRTYPDIYNETPTDRQAWMRLWITKNMREELKRHGK